MAEACKALRGAQGDAAYRALWSLADSPKAAEFIANRLMQIRTVLDPRVLARGQDAAEAKRRLELASKASAYRTVSGEEALAYPAAADSLQLAEEDLLKARMAEPGNQMVAFSEKCRFIQLFIR